MNTRSGKTLAPKDNSEMETSQKEGSRTEILLEALFQSLTEVRQQINSMDTRLYKVEMKSEHAFSPEQSVSPKDAKNYGSTEKAQSQSPEPNKNNATPVLHDFSFFTAPGSPERFASPTSVKLTHASIPGQVTIVRGTTTDYTKKLKSITDLYKLINHLLDFDNWRRTHDSTQKLVSTLDAACLIELRLGTRESLVHLDDEQMLGYIKAYWHLVPPQKENYLRILEKIQIIEPDTDAGYISEPQAVQQSYMRLQSYLERLDKNIAIIKDLTGVSYLENKPNKLSVSRLYTYSTIWDLVYEKLRITMPGWCDVMVADINVRDYVFWTELSTKLSMNASAAVQLFHKNHVVLKGLFTIMKQSKIGDRRAISDNSNVASKQDKQSRTDPTPQRLWQRNPAYTPQSHPRANLANLEEIEEDNPELQKTTLEQHEEEEQFESDYADLAALGQGDPIFGVCHHWLLGNCINNPCKYPHTVGAAAAHLAKVEAAVKAKSAIIGKLAAISSNAASGMRTTATITTENGNTALCALIDPGSDTYNFISKDVVNRLGLHIHNTEPIMIRLGGTGQIEPTLGTVTITVNIDGQPATIELQVFNTKEELIIGLPDIRTHFLKPTMRLLTENTDSPLQSIYALDPAATLAALTDDELADQLKQTMNTYAA
jgi:predicted aspartyl protease